MPEVLVRGEERQIVPDGELCKQRNDGTDLYACLATCVSQNRGAYMIVAISLRQRQGGETFDDLRSGIQRVLVEAGTQE
jgi:hypothetical protein